jgi:hypothetical protein
LREEDDMPDDPEARTRAPRDQLVADGWLALAERIEQGEAPKPPSALEKALTEHVAPAQAAPTITVSILGRLEHGEKGAPVQ